MNGKRHKLNMMKNLVLIKVHKEFVYIALFIATLLVVMAFSNTIGITYLYCDAARPWQLSFQDPATPVMEGIISLHHHIVFFLIIILVFVFYMLSRTLVLFRSKNNTEASREEHGVLIEIIWTFIPSAILTLIALPSFQLLYSMDEMIDPTITIKTVGHQWYWSYEYSDYTGDYNDSISFDSYMVPEEDLLPGQLRLLEVDEPLVVPVKTHISFVLTSADVIHSWAVPSLGVKLDAIPGRLNQVSVFIQREGTYYGQCSELCGVNHGFMPIVVKAVSDMEYVNWLDARLSKI